MAAANLSRRNFLGATAATAAALSIPATLRAAVQAAKEAVQGAFRVAVISDEISMDFDHACSVIANDFNLQWVELRGLFGKNILKLDDKEVADAIKILTKYKLRVTDIASPLFKTDFPGAPRSKSSPAVDHKADAHGADFTFKEQDEILERSIALAHQFHTERIRCFDFWRLDDVDPYREAINAKLFEAAVKAGAQKLMLVLENEFECNTATARESAATLAVIDTPYLMLNWDPGNAVARGEADAFPTGFDLLPKNRIGHCHVKCAVLKPGTKAGFEWAAVGKGLPDWNAQFKALKKAGYKHAVSLETHWTGGGSPEASSRISWDGMAKALQTSGAVPPSAVPGDWPKIDITG